MVAERKIDQRRLIPGTREVKTCAGKNKAGAPCRATWGGMTLVGGRYYCHAHEPGKVPSPKLARGLVQESDNRPVPTDLVDRLCRAQTLGGGRCRHLGIGGMDGPRLCLTHQHLARKRWEARTATQAARTPQETGPAPKTSLRASGAPPSAFAAICAGLQTQIAERAARGPKTWAETLAEGARAREERALRELRERAATGVVPTRRKATADQVIALVADYYGVEASDLKGKRRDQVFAYPRQVCMYLLRQKFTISLTEIGKHLGGRDHTTCMYGVAKIEREVVAGSVPLLRELAEIAGELRLAGLAS